MIFVLQQELELHRRDTQHQFIYIFFYLTQNTASCDLILSIIIFFYRYLIFFLLFFLKKQRIWFVNEYELIQSFISRTRQNALFSGCIKQKECSKTSGLKPKPPPNVANVITALTSGGNMEICSLRGECSLLRLNSVFSD